MADEKEVKQQRVVIAIDESDESIYAMTWYLNNMVSIQNRYTIILLYAQPLPPVYSSLDGTGYIFSGDFLAVIQKHTQDLTESVIERAKLVYQDYNNIKVKKVVEKGDARDVICGMVDKLGADLLVMGSHGYGFVKRALLGSVSNHCAKKAKCPVLIVKRPSM